MSEFWHLLQFPVLSWRPRTVTASRKVLHALNRLPPIIQ